VTRCGLCGTNGFMTYAGDRVIHDADHGLTNPAWRHAYTTMLVNWITEMIAGERTAQVTSKKRLQEVMKTQSVHTGN